MHQTSSRLLRMTSNDRPFTRDLEDLFTTLMVSLKLETNSTSSLSRFWSPKVNHSFFPDEAIKNLGSLKFSQSNRMPDPKDPSRIVTTTTTTTFSMLKEMARSVCQRFMDARYIESADGKTHRFPEKGNTLFQLTPKGIYLLQRFCQRNGITAPHVMDVLESPRNTMRLVVLERDSETDMLNTERGFIEVIFRRFIGLDGPNVKNTSASSDSEALNEYASGMVGVKMARERKINDKTFYHTFTGKACLDWIMDCTTVVDRRETYYLAETLIDHGLMWAISQDLTLARSNAVFGKFQPTKNAIYALTERGKRVCGWIARERTAVSPSNDTSLFTRDSNHARLQTILQKPALRHLFREFLLNSLCEENLSFYMDVSAFTGNYHQQANIGALTNLDTVRETLASAYGIYNAFLAPGSPCELNIEHNLRNRLASQMTKAVSDDNDTRSMVMSLQEVVSLFEAAQDSVFKLMSSDSVPKFVREPRYAFAVQEHKLEPNSRTRSPAAPSTSTETMPRSTPIIPERSGNRSVKMGS